MSDKVDSTIIFRVLRKMGTPFVQLESYKAGVIDKHGKVIVPPNKRSLEQKRAYSVMERVVIELKKSSSPDAYVNALRLMREFVEDKSNESTAVALFEKMEQHNLVPTVPKHDISTYEGYMDAVEEVMEMFSGAAIGGAFDGAQSNAATNASGMAAPNGPTKKKKKIDSILNRRF